MIVIKRLLALIPVAAGVVIIVSLLIHMVPGNPADVVLGPYASDSEKQQYLSSMGLDQPIPKQIVTYFTNLLAGDLGTSMIYQKPVTELIQSRVAATLELAMCAMLVAASLSLPLGILSAVFRGKWVDYTAMGFALVGVAIPNFWLGPLLILVFSLYLGILPVSERAGLDSYVLPSLSLGMALAAMLSRMTRNSMLETMKEDFIRTARSKGAGEWTVICKHVLRNAALPLVTVVGLQFGVLLTGAIITERIFDWPGLGSLILEGINNRDYPVVQGCVLTFSATYLLVNLLTDLVYSWVDPRIRKEA
jgi:peptide/nickel transport system permease protein